MERHCTTCTCELTQVTWSDRECWVDLTDPKSVANAVLACALDHSYDRTGTGVPYGIPKGLAEVLGPVVAKHLSAVEPDWENKTVYMAFGPSRNNFEAELIAAVTKCNGS